MYIEIIINLFTLIYYFHQNSSNYKPIFNMIYLTRSGINPLNTFYRVRYMKQTQLLLLFFFFTYKLPISIH